MCTKPLACPLCSQAAFLTLDALRTGLISVATRPLACPVCTEVLLGIDKLTIHLFSHTIDLSIGCTRNLDSSTNSVDAVDNDQSTSAQFSNSPTTWNTSDKSSRAKKVFRGEFTEPARNVPEAPVPKEQPPAVLGPTIIVSKSSQSQEEQHLSTNHLDSSVQGTSQLIYVQTKGLLQHSSNNYFQEQISQADGFASNHEKISPTINGLSGDGTENSSNANNQDEAVQFQPIWSEDFVPNATNDGQSRVKNTENHPAKAQDVTAEQRIAEVSRKILEQDKKEPVKILPQLKALRTLTGREKNNRCDICGFYFSDPNILTLHKQLAHLINEKDLSARPEEFLKNYPCHLCSKVFKMRGSLMVHMRVAHVGHKLGSSTKEGIEAPVASETGYNCPTCGKNFKKEQHVTQHLKTHEGKQWECDVCSKMFTTKYFLKKHKRLHSGEMPYKCNICEKTFTFQQSYHKHRLYHKDDKPHTCATCGRSFKELSTLHNHERIHTGEKPFACETCGKCFRQRVSYLVHRRIHTGAMPYKCTACGKSFRYKVSQRTHKCPAQPPGTVVRQSSELVQRLIQVSQIKGQSTDALTTPVQEAQSFVTDDNNRFILMVNSQGQHILARQSDVEYTRVTSTAEEPKDSDERFIEDLWGHNIPTGTTLKDSIDISTRNEGIEDQTKTDPANDFFSMVLSPIGNEVRSPVSQMEHLRLSSPTNNDDVGENISKEGSRAAEDLDTTVNGVPDFRNESDDNPLATINEESLKQLLYGTEDDS